MVYRNFMLLVLLLIFAFNLSERQVLALVMESIKQDFQLSDSQLGLLSGLAFTLFYSIMGIPIARWADRGNRRTLVSAAMLLWGLMVSLCGAAANFVQLLLLRIGVAVGEAGCIPPAHSLIADYFCRAERARAVSIYMLGAPLSIMIGFFAGGWLNELYGWRNAFVMLGVVGVIAAVLSRLVLREPRLDAGPVAVEVAEQSILEVFLVLWRNISFRRLLIAFAVLHFFGYGVGLWLPTYFIRSFAMGTAEIGVWFALIWGVVGALGTYLGGYLVSRYAANNEALQLRASAWAFVIFSVVNLFIYLTASKLIALVLLSISAALIMGVNGPIFAIVQTLVDERMRAMSIAAVYLFANLIGMGLGPLFVGVVSDLLSPLYGNESLRYALLACAPGYLLVTLSLWMASRTVERDLGGQGVPEKLSGTVI